LAIPTWEVAKKSGGGGGGESANFQITQQSVEAALDDGPDVTTGPGGVDVREAAHTGDLKVAQPESALRRLD
jgi:hypothetical protein